MSAKSGTLNLRIEPAKHDRRTRAAEKYGKCLSGCMTEGIRSVRATCAMGKRFTGVSAEGF